MAGKPLRRERGMQLRTQLFLLVSLIALLVDVLFVVVNQRNAERHLMQALTLEGGAMCAAVETGMQAALTNMLQLATLICCQACRQEPLGALFLRTGAGGGCPGLTGC